MSGCPDGFLSFLDVFYLTFIFILQSLAALKDSSCYSKTSIGTGIRGVLYMDITDSGGGGGGGTFVFVVSCFIFLSFVE